jgi:hypothetical protein
MKNLEIPTRTSRSMLQRKHRVHPLYVVMFTILSMYALTSLYDFGYKHAKERLFTHTLNHK